MKLKDFDYNLPKELIAQEPMKPRDHSRLLVLSRKSGWLEHKHFYDLPDYLRAGDVLVLNNTKVMRARLIGRKAETGGRVEVFLLKKNNSILSSRPRTLRGRDPSNAVFATSKGFLANARNDNLEGGEVWQCLVGGKKRKESLCVEFVGGLEAEIVKNNQDGTWNVKFNKSGVKFMKIIEKIGQVPLPPYIKRSAFAKNSADRQTYQTVYADDKKLGSVAAPTAGFHFTPALLRKLKNQGVQIEYVTLRVGLGTFAPVKVDDITKHKMHAEWIEAKASAIKRIQRATLEGRRIVTVGTTSARALESVFNSNDILERSVSGVPSVGRAGIEYSYKKRKRDPIGPPGQKPGAKGAPSRMTDYAFWTDIFIYPGYKFKAVDAMITNFHLPKSTLVMLVSAFAGREKIFKAYGEAIKRKYRFYSYGDAMLIV